MSKRIFAVIISCLMILGGLNLNGSFVKADELSWSDDTIRANQYASKDDDAKTIEITSAKQLGLLAYEVKNGTSYEGYTITLKNDIDLSAYNWDPIGYYTQRSISETTTAFRGNFDGNNHTISNMNINVESVSDGNKAYGFFGGVVTGSVKNLNF